MTVFNLTFVALALSCFFLQKYKNVYTFFQGPLLIL